MSKAAGFFEPGGPEVLELVDVAEPKAAAGQVRVRVKAAGVQPFDLAVVEGFTFPGTEPAFPRVPGNEFAGIIDQVGEGTTGFLPGDEVLGFGMLGGWCEHIVTTPDQITRKPATMSWEVAGGFSAGAQTAHIALRELAVGDGDTVLIHGAAGAVGTVAVQLARLWGAKVIGAAREQQHDYLRSLGAIPLAYGDAFVERVRDLAPEGVTAALDGVGGQALEDSLELVEDRDRILTLFEHGKAPELGVRTTPPTRSAARLAELADLYAQGRLNVHILKSFPLARAGDAFRTHRAGNVRGKIVLTIEGDGAAEADGAGE